MSQFILAQTVAGGGSDFDGSAGSGLFSFPASALPKTESYVCQQLGIFGLAATATWVVAYFQPPPGFGQVGAPILVGAATSTDLAGVDGNLAVTFCPGQVPRASSGVFWSLAVYSDGLTDEATATLTYVTTGGC
jgi:hypothetical protein